MDESNNKNYKLAITAVFWAIISFMTFTPFGMVPLVVVSVNLVLVPIILATQCEGLKVGVVCSTFFGVLSLIKSYISPTTLLAPYFQNPLISIVPRILIGFSVHFSFKLFLNLFGKRRWLASAASAIVGVFTNTALVLGLLCLLYGSSQTSSGAVITLMGGILVTNSLPELAICTLLVPSIYASVSRLNLMHKSGK